MNVGRIATTGIRVGNLAIAACLWALAAASEASTAAMSAPLRRRRSDPALGLLIALLVLVGAGGLGASPGRAATAKPCWERVVDDWLDNGTIDGTYSPSCYQAALKHVPEDLRDYSNIDAAISVALQDTLRSAGSSVKAAGGARQSSAVSGSKDGNATEANSRKSGYGTIRTLQNLPRRSIYRRAVDSLGGTTANSLPIPLLVLAGLGSALFALALALAARSRIRGHFPRDLDSSDQQKTTR